MRLKWLGMGVALALGGAAAGWWFASPWWTLKAMREAAAAHDERKLSAYVDYPALRESLKDDVMRRITTDGRGAEGLGAIGAQVANAIAGPLIDAAVTPQGVQAMFDGEQAARQPGATPETKAGQLPPLPAAKDRPVIERGGLNQFRVHAREPGSATMVFRRDGLGWKLAGVDLPPPPNAGATE
ncbi:MAG: DUF2939 domain-containing protein [Sphingomicrobium sp.]